jgi:ribosomal protein L29
MATKSDKKIEKVEEIKEAEVVEKAAKAEKPAKKAEKFDAAKVDNNGLIKLQAEMQAYRMEILSGKEKNTAKLKEMRRNIARVKTYINRY